MSDDVSTAAVDGAGREFRGEAEWRALMADFERWDGSQTSFCEARGVPPKTFQGWRRRFGLTAGKPRGKHRGKPGGFVEIAAASGPGWDAELSLGDGVVLRQPAQPPPLSNKRTTPAGWSNGGALAPAARPSPPMGLAPGVGGVGLTRPGR